MHSVRVGGDWLSNEPFETWRRVFACAIVQRRLRVVVQGLGICAPFHIAAPIVLGCPSHKVVSVRVGASRSQAASIVLCGLRIEVRSLRQRASVDFQDVTYAVPVGVSKASAVAVVHQTQAIHLRAVDAGAVVDGGCGVVVAGEGIGAPDIQWDGQMFPHRMDHQAPCGSPLHIQGQFCPTIQGHLPDEDPQVVSSHRAWCPARDAKNPAACLAVDFKTKPIFKRRKGFSHPGLLNVGWFAGILNPDGPPTVQGQTGQQPFWVGWD